MTLTIPREALTNALATVTRAAPRTPRIPILTAVHIDADANTATLRCTNLEMEITASVPCIGEGTFLVNAHSLAGIVRLLKGDDVNFDHHDAPERLVVSSGPSRYTFYTYDEADYPTALSVDGDEHDVDREAFLAACEDTTYAASQDDSRPVLNALNVTIGEGGIRIDATDSYRLVTHDTFGPPPRGTSFLAGVNAITEAAKIVKADGALGITIDQNLVRFWTPIATLTTRLVTGQYPEVEKLFSAPSDDDHVIEIPRVETLEALRRVSIIAERNHPATLDFRAQTLGITATKDEVGKGHELITIDWPGEFTIGLNVPYLTEALAHAHGDVVTLRFTTPLRPVILTDDSPTRQLIMPVRLPGT